MRDAESASATHWQDLGKHVDQHVGQHVDQHVALQIWGILNYQFNKCPKDATYLFVLNSLQSTKHYVSI